MIRRKQLKKNGKIHWDISIKRLMKRDKGICYLCGENCNLNNYITLDNGTIVTGESYPSIEHIIPVSKGGTHTWDNVKVAHRKCNSEKGAKIIEAIK